jgi:hypothetical protein
VTIKPRAVLAGNRRLNRERDFVDDHRIAIGGLGVDYGNSAPVYAMLTESADVVFAWFTTGIEA